MYERAVNKCDSIYDKIEVAISTAAVVNRREALYNQSLTDYSKLQEIRKKFSPFNSLWSYPLRHDNCNLRLVKNG